MYHTLHVDSKRKITIGFLSAEEARKALDILIANTAGKRSTSMMWLIKYLDKEDISSSFKYDLNKYGWTAKLLLPWVFDSFKRFGDLIDAVGGYYYIYLPPAAPLFHKKKGDKK